MRLPQFTAGAALGQPVHYAASARKIWQSPTRNTIFPAAGGGCIYVDGDLVCSGGPGGPSCTPGFSAPFKVGKKTCRVFRRPDCSTKMICH